MHLIKTFFKFLLKLLITISICSFAFIVFIAFQVKQNQIAKTTYYDIHTKKINKDLKIVQLSDYHDFKDYQQIVELVKKENPNVVVCTGDMFDAARIDIVNTFNLFKSLKENINCEIIYIPGNHEAARPNEHLKLLEKLEEINIIYLENSKISLTIEGNEINFANFLKKDRYDYSLINSLGTNNLNIFLIHRPEFIETYVKNKEVYLEKDLDYSMDLILTGHVHGGQFRFFGKGIYAPDQGWFPKYSSGLFKLTEEETMIISRGIGNSSFPLRINNNPEIVVINLLNDNK